MVYHNSSTAFFPHLQKGTWSHCWWSIGVQSWLAINDISKYIVMKEVEVNLYWLQVLILTQLADWNKLLSYEFTNNNGCQ